MAQMTVKKLIELLSQIHNKDLIVKTLQYGDGNGESYSLTVFENEIDIVSENDDRSEEFVILG